MNIIFLLISLMLVPGRYADLFNNGKNEHLFTTLIYNSCYIKQSDDSYCIVTGVEKSSCSRNRLGVPNKCNDQLTDCKACLARGLNILREESENNFNGWCAPLGGYVTEYNSSSPVCK